MVIAPENIVHLCLLLVHLCVCAFCVLVALKYMLLEAQLEAVGSIKRGSILCLPDCEVLSYSQTCIACLVSVSSCVSTRYAIVSVALLQHEITLSKPSIVPSCPALQNSTCSKKHARASSCTLVLHRAAISKSLHRCFQN